jgi:flagellar biosynthesis/type III secretory pathway chaperone
MQAVEVKLLQNEEKTKNNNVMSETYLDRLKVEHDELSEKIEKLESALKNKRIPEYAVEVNERQLEVMKEYRAILLEKIIG